MTKIELLNFKCKRCGKDFLSYVEGKNLYGCHEDGVCFDIDGVSIIHENHVLNPIFGMRECRKCRKGVDLMSFGLHT
jgi:hypothetical protein